MQRSSAGIRNSGRIQTDKTGPGMAAEVHSVK